MYEPLEPAQERALVQMRDVLQDDFVEFRVTAYELTEDFETGRAEIRCHVCVNGAPPFDVVGEGVGMIDAFFNGLKARFAPEYPSLESIRFTEFSIRGLVGESRAGAATDAQARAQVEVTNSYGTNFRFGAVSGSVSRSSVEATLSAVQYFVNSERAYVTMYKALRHYRAEGRVDLVGKYTAMLADMVRNTSYSSAVARIETESKQGGTR